MARAPKRFVTSKVLPPESKTVVLDPSETHHLHDVLRLDEGDECLVLDGGGKKWRGEIRFVQVAKTKLAHIVSLKPVLSQMPKKIHLTIAQAIPQRGKMDSIVEKAAELGVGRLIPLVSERTIVRIKKEAEGAVLARWQKIIQASRKQSHSAAVTEIARPASFRNVLEELRNFDRAFLFDPGTTRSIFEAVRELRDQEASKVGILIGPEGGFSPKEIELASQNGVKPIRLGDSILKTDTAFVVIAGLFQLLLNESDAN